MGPLTGITVVTIALNTPGPLAAARLRDEGAAVVKIEPPGGDPLATISPAWYRELHDGVSVERIDLKSDAGHARMKELLSTADVLLSSQRPSALERLGLGAAALRERFPRLRHVNIVGETDAPEVPGHDLTYLAQAGLVRDGMPVSLIADVMGSEHAFAAVLLVLRQPPGTRRQVGLFDSLRPMAAPLRHGLTAPGGLLGGGLPAYGVYETKEGRVAIAALEPHFRQRLYELLQLPLDSALAGVLKTRTAAEWAAWAAEHDLPLASVRAQAGEGGRA